MPRVETDRLAVEDLDRIYDYIGIEHSNREAADRFIHDIHAKFLQYARQPEMGEPRFDLGEGLRSFLFKKNYVVIYRPREDGIDVLRVFHGARDYPSLFGGE